MATKLLNDESMRDLTVGYELLKKVRGHLLGTARGRKLPSAVKLGAPNVHRMTTPLSSRGEPLRVVLQMVVK